MLKMGIIGSGFGVYGLLPGFHEIPGISITCLCAKQTLRVTDACKKYEVAHLYDSWKKMLDTQKIDIVAVAVVPSAQFKICSYALKKNIHVFAEKPLTTAVEKARVLLQLAEKRNLIHAVDFIFPEIPSFAALKNYLDKVDQEKIESIEVQWKFLSYDIRNQIQTWKTDSTQGGGAVSFYFSHVLYYTEWLLGPMKIQDSQLTHSSKSLNGGEVAAKITAFFGKTPGFFEINCDSDENIHKITITTKDEVLTLSNSSEIFDNFTFEIKDRMNNCSSVYANDAAKRQIDDDRVKLITKIGTRFIEACNTHSPFLPSFVSGLRVQQLIDEIREKNEKKQ